MERLTEKACSNSVSVIFNPFRIDDCGINKANQQVTLSSVTTTTQESYTSSNYEVTLENESVWSRFHSVGTEMILTKQGRRMFPCCRFRMSGLDPQRKYFLVMEIMPLDDFTHKWNGKRWEPVAVDELKVLSQISVHPESPSLGQQWMDSPVSFYKVKLTSDSMDQEGCVLLRPMRRYLPRLYIVPVDPESEKTVALNGPNVKIFSFPQTEFYAVTSYQNPQITQLKIDCNPFAMAFREDSQSIRLLKDKLGLCSSLGAHFQSPLLSLTRDLGGKPKKGAVKTTESTRIDKNRKTDLYPGSVNLKEGDVIFTKMGSLNCPKKIALCQTDTDCNKNNKHIAPCVDVEPCVTIALEETLSSTDETLLSLSNNENPSFSVDAINSQISDTNSESPTHFSMPEIKPVAGPPPNSPVPNSSHVHLPKTGHLYRLKYDGRRRKAKAKWWSKGSKTLPAVFPHTVPLQPDLEDVDGMLFVSFVAKEALNIPGENRKNGKQSPPSPYPAHDQSYNHEIGDVSVKERIAHMEKNLLCHLKQQKHRQVIHPCLQDVGMKLNLLDPNSVIDLQYLGVHLPLSSTIQEDLDQMNPMKLSSSTDTTEPFVSRTGKTNDPTKIKGWRDKFQANTVQTAPESLKNSSAFCSEMLDAYLENEAQQISDRVAVFSKCSALPVSYQLPSKSSSYVVTLDSLLKTRSISANKVHSKPTDPILPKSPPRNSPCTAAPLSSAGFQQSRQRGKAEKFVHSCQPQSVTKFPGRTTSRFVSRRRMQKQPGKSQRTWKSSAGTVCHIKRGWRPVINVRLTKGMMLQKMEEGAMLHGKFHTCITKKRANFALTALFNFQKPPKSCKFPFHYRHNNACSKDFCLLGCICDSLAREIRGPTHCRRVECMFDCSCFKHKVLLHHSPNGTANIQRGRKRSVLSFSIADQKREPRPPPPPTITTLWDRTAGNGDPEPLLVPAAPLFLKRMCHLRPSLSCFSSQVREEDKDFVYLYFESMMTCARVREYNSNPPPQIHMVPTKKEMKDPKQLDEISDPSEPASQKTPDTNPTETPVIPAEPKPTKLVEILSECNWEPHRNLVLNTLFRHMNSNLISEPFCIGMYKIQLLSTTVKGADRSIMYKVCISRAEEKEMTNDLQVEVKKTSRKNFLKKGFENQGSETIESQSHKDDPGTGQMRSAMVEMQPHKSLSRLPSHTDAGHLRARKPGINSKGLIKVNGKTYNNAKLLLGKVGALHPANCFSAFVPGTVLPVPQDQDKRVGEQDDACPPKAPLKPSSLEKMSNVSKEANVPGSNPSAKNCRSNTSQSNAIPKLIGKHPIIPDGSRFLLVPVTPPNFVAAPSSETVSSSTLPPGQQVVLQPAPGMPGSHFMCQYNGQMIQLKPLSSVALAPVQLKSDSEGTANTILQKDTKSLHNPLKSTPQILAQNWPVSAPKAHTLSTKDAINIDNGTPALNLQSSFPAKTGTFCFRICPPNSESKLVEMEHGGKPPETSVDSPTMVLPGGFTLIKLSSPTVPAVPTKVTSEAPHSSEISQNDESTMTTVSQSCSQIHDQNRQVSERISSTFPPSNTDTACLSQCGNGFPFKLAIKDESVEYCSESGHSEPRGKFKWICKDSEMVLKSISKLEPNNMDDWPHGEAEHILWMDSEEEEDNKRLNKATLDIAPESSAAEETSEDACSKSSYVVDQNNMGEQDIIEGNGAVVDIKDIFGNLPDNCTKTSKKHQHDLKEETREMTEGTDRVKTNAELGEVCNDEDIIVDVMNLSENEDEGPIDKDTSSDDSDEDSDNDEEDSSDDSTSDSETSERGETSSADNVDIESFEDSDVKKIVSVMKSQTRHEMDKKRATMLAEQHCTSGVSTSTEQEKRQNHTEKERVRRGEMCQQFSVLKKALDIDEHVRMSKHDILNQALLMIRALEDRGRYLENWKKALIQRHSDLSRSLVLSVEKTENRDSVHIDVNCKQKKRPESKNSLQTSAPAPLVNPRRLDSDGNKLPPRLGCWKAPNYIRKRSRKALVTPSVSTTVVAEKSLNTPSCADTQDSQTASIPLPLGKTENLVRTLIAQNPNCLPSLCKTPQQTSLSESKETETGLLPKIAVEPLDKLTRAVRTLLPSSTDNSDPAELRNDSDMDPQNQNKEVEKCSVTRDANVVENAVSEHSNKESPTSNTSVIESDVKNNTSPALERDAQASVEEVKVKGKRGRYDVVDKEEALSNPEVLGLRRLRKRSPVVGGATRGGLTKRRRII